MLANLKEESEFVEKKDVMFEFSELEIGGQNITAKIDKALIPEKDGLELEKNNTKPEEVPLE